MYRSCAAWSWDEDHGCVRSHLLLRLIILQTNGTVMSCCRIRIHMNFIIGWHLNTNAVKCWNTYLRAVLEHRHFQMKRTSLFWRDSTNEVCAIFDWLSAMESALFSCEALANNFRRLVDFHVLPRRWVDTAHGACVIQKWSRYRAKECSSEWN